VTRALALFALALLLVACGAPTPAAVPARVEVAAAQTSTAVWRIVGSIGDWNVDLSIYQETGTPPTPVQTPSATQTAPVTNTPRPTLQPSVTLQFTPSPTYTPVHTPTPQIASQTPTEAYTPTPEMTPPPTPTGATAVPKVCELKTNRTINKRSGPGTTYVVVGSQAAGTNVRPIAFQVGGQYLWAQLDLRTWLVVRDIAAPGTWWVDTVDGEGVCEDVPGWPEGLEPPGAIVRIPALAIHETQGIDRADLGKFMEVLRAAGVPFGVKSVSDPSTCLVVLAAGGLCVYREWTIGDCPNIYADPEEEAYRWMIALWGAAHNLRPTFLEISNECQLDPMDLTRFWNPFIIEAVRLGKQWEYPPLVIPTWGPGNPTQEWHLDLIAPALTALRDSGGALGLHNYAIDENG